MFDVCTSAIFREFLRGNRPAMTDHLLIFQDEDDVFSSGSLASPHTKPKGKFLSFPHPRTGSLCRYLVVGDHLCEVQKTESTSPSSWFVDQGVRADGSFLFATRIDPLFLIIPLLEKAGTSFSPLEQVIAQYGGDSAPDMQLLRQCKNFELDRICDINDAMGDDMLLVRLDRDKTLEWARRKVLRLKGVLLSDAKERGGVSGTQERAALCESVLLIGEYFTSAWTQKIASSFDLTDDDLKSSQKGGGVSRGQAEAAGGSSNGTDSGPHAGAECYTMGSSRSNKVAKSSAKPRVNNKLKGSTKGMASMMSFFAKKT